MYSSNSEGHVQVPATLPASAESERGRRAPLPFEFPRICLFPRLPLHAHGTHARTYASAKAAAFTAASASASASTYVSSASSATANSASESAPASIPWARGEVGHLGRFLLEEAAVECQLE